MKQFINIIMNNKVVRFIVEVAFFLIIFLSVYFYLLNIETSTTPNYIYSQF